MSIDSPSSEICSTMYLYAMVRLFRSVGGCSICDDAPGMVHCTCVNHATTIYILVRSITKMDMLATTEAHVARDLPV